MTVSKATIHDIDPLSMLFNEYRIFYKKESDLQNISAFLSERLNNNDSVIFVAKSANNNFMGFVQLYPLFSSTRMKRLWLLNDLYVNPTFRGQKVSVMLIDRAKQLALETNSAGLMLETAKSNAAGNNLYRKTDFILDTEHNYYSWGD
jgi:ribosomal protein S18 acetylase RimI-like enzyme